MKNATVVTEESLARKSSSRNAVGDVDVVELEISSRPTNNSKLLRVGGLQFLVWNLL